MFVQDQEGFKLAGMIFNVSEAKRIIAGRKPNRRLGVMAIQQD
jgi:hypothetical protein